MEMALAPVAGDLFRIWRHVTFLRHIYETCRQTLLGVWALLIISSIDLSDNLVLFTDTGYCEREGNTRWTQRRGQCPKILGSSPGRELIRGFTRLNESLISAFG